MRYQLKITLQDIDPPIWRRVTVPGELTLLDLHLVIQVLMGWEDCHLHEFTAKRQRYAPPGPDGLDDALDESEAMLCDVAAPRAKISYHYDFGDSWKHVILVEKAVDDHAAADPIPACVEGARACPPEDSGGPWGYADKLEALSGADDEESEDLREWMGDFDPEQFDIDSINKELRRAFRTRPRSSKRPKKRGKAAAGSRVAHGPRSRSV